MFLNNNSIKSTSPLFTLSVAATLSGVPAHSIRQYIDQGLIIPYKKESERHLFSNVDVERLKFIHKQLHEHGLNFAGIRCLLALLPCWKIRSCEAGETGECLAYSASDLPCWEASEKGRQCRNLDCRECDVYRFVEKEKDIKSVLKIL